MKTIRIAPSEIAFMWDSCQRCWYRRVNGLQKPKEALPQMFRVVDSGMKFGLGIEEVRDHFGIPAASVCSFEQVISEPIDFEEFGVRIVIKGKIDRALVLDDGTFGLLEFKMAEPSDRNVRKYERQCHCYETALCYPASGEPKEVSRIDLIFYEPFDKWCRIKKRDSDGAILCTPTSGTLVHRSVEIDRARFQNETLREMAKVAGSLDLPEAAPNCDYCATVAATVVYDTNLSKIAATAQKKGAA